ncbi:MAG: DNA polymerase III subunit delta [Clostridia bacterium]|nr:DNA polymerase III subunit delta [Clostridia bacterium]
MNYDSLERELNTNLRSIYLLYGEEQYLIDMAIKKIKKKFGELLLGINYIVLDESNIDDLIPNIEMPAFGYEKKLIIVKNSGLFKKDGRKKTPTEIQERIGNYISDNLNIINEGVILIFVESEVDKNSVYDLIERTGIVCQIDLLKPNQIVQKLKKICALYKVNASDMTLNYLIETSGTSLQDLINEIRKLIEYVGENGTITEKEVDLLASKQIESIIFDLTDSLGLKQTDKALEVLNNLIYQKEPIQKILVTLYNHFKKLYFCKEAVRLNKDVVNSLNLKPTQTFLVTKYKKQASYFKENDLKNIMEELVNLDYNYKIGNIDLDVGLRSILCRFC